jgi:hypothetical protein
MMQRIAGQLLWDRLPSAATAVGVFAAAAAAADEEERTVVRKLSDLPHHVLPCDLCACRVTCFHQLTVN